MKYYYANAQNQPVGPVELADLQRLLAERKISPTTNIIAEGGSAWVPLSSVLPGLPPAPRSRAGTFSLPTILADLAAKALNGVRGLVSSATFSKWMQFVTKAGQAFILIGAALGLVYSIAYGIKTNQLSLFFGGILSIVAIGLLQFVAQHFLKACERLIANNPSRISSPAVLDSFGLVLLLGGIASLVGGIVAGVTANSLSAFLFGFVWSIFLFLGAVVSLHPKVLSISVIQSSAGEEAMGVVSFFLKGGLAVLPVIFAVVALFGILAVAIGLFTFSNPNYFYGEFGWLYHVVPAPFYEALGVLGVGGVGFGILIFAAFLPLIAYLLFLGTYVGVDLVNAIVGIIPRKLDTPRRQD